MYWYIAYVDNDYIDNLVDFFNRQENCLAFIPKMEKWYNVKSIKNYVVRKLYPNYVLIKSHLDKKAFIFQYNGFFNSLKGSVSLLQYDNTTTLNRGEQAIFEQLFDNESIIRHSIGNIVDSKLIVDQGPLKGLEDLVIKIDRHHRIATLKTNFLGQPIRVALEVVSKT